MTDETNPARKPAVRSDIPGTLRITEEAKQAVRAAMQHMSVAIPGLQGVKIDPASAMLRLIIIGAARVVEEATGEPSKLGGK